jgi:hypothetical protein
MSRVGLALAVSASVLAGCASAPAPSFDMRLGPQTTRIEGWMIYGGEWQVFGARSELRRYDPFIADEQKKCVSLIDVTRLPNAALNSMRGRAVVVTGRVVRYDSLSDRGTDFEPTWLDTMFAKKFFGNQEVRNFCLRQDVFVATKIELRR